MLKLTCIFVILITNTIFDLYAPPSKGDGWYLLKRLYTLHLFGPVLGQEEPEV